MKKNKVNRLNFVAKLWGTPIPIIIDSSFPPVIKWYWGVLLIFFGYIVLFNLPIEFPPGGALHGWYLAVVLMSWTFFVVPPILSMFSVQVEDKRKKKDWHYLTLLKDESGVFHGELKHKKHNPVLLYSFQYQLYYKKTEIGEILGYDVFIVCTDSKNEQFIILSTKWKKLEIEFTDATEITSIPQEWSKMLFLACNPFYLLEFIKQITPY